MTPQPILPTTSVARDAPTALADYLLAQDALTPATTALQSLTLHLDQRGGSKVPVFLTYFRLRFLHILLAHFHISVFDASSTREQPPQPGSHTVSRVPYRSEPVQYHEVRDFAFGARCNETTYAKYRTAWRRMCSIASLSPVDSPRYSELQDSQKQFVRMIVIISTGPLFVQLEEDHDDDHHVLAKLSQKAIEAMVATSR